MLSGRGDKCQPPGNWDNLNPTSLGTAMNDARQEPVKQALEAWIRERMGDLREQILLTWDEGQGRLAPDEALLQRLASLAPAPAAPGVAEGTEAELGAALDLIEGSGSQGDVLKRLLEGLQPFVERSALFVVKQGIASLYAQRGFEADNPRMGAPVVPPPELDALIQGTRPRIERPGPAYQALLGPLSRFEASDAWILPLALRRKCVALLLVDAGLRQVLDHPNHVRALVRAAESCLSHLAGMKEEERTAPPPPPPPSSPTMRIPEPISEPPEPALDPKVRANAERSARVLVGDIELYFPAKVAQGRQTGRLYPLLREELDRSRASFVDRYGHDLEERHHIFYTTVVQQLCEGNAGLLAGAPWGPKG